jgi:hypothetical protein
VSLQTRLKQLEKRSGIADGRCPTCGLGPDDLRLIEVCRPAEGDESNDRDGPPGPGGKPVSERPTCPRCGGLVGPLVFAEEAADGSLWVRDRPGPGDDTEEGARADEDEDENP